MPGRSSCWRAQRACSAGGGIDDPFAGSRMLRVLLRAEGIEIGRQRGATLMRRMGVEAIYRRPNTCHGHKIYPYLLRSVSIGRLNQVWATDITYIPMAPWWWSSSFRKSGCAARFSPFSARG